MKYLIVYALAALLLTTATYTQNSTVKEIQQDVLRRIREANYTVGGTTRGGHHSSLKSIRVIDPFVIANLIAGMTLIYSTIVENYPDFVYYDVVDAKLMQAQYKPQKVSFSYVKRC